jgi:hypothetical protein
LVVEIEFVDLIAEIRDVVEDVLVIALKLGVLEKNGMGWHGGDSFIDVAGPAGPSW